GLIDMLEDRGFDSPPLDHRHGRSCVRHCHTSTAVTPSALTIAHNQARCRSGSHTPPHSQNLQEISRMRLPIATCLAALLLAAPALAQAPAQDTAKETKQDTIKPT